MPTGQNSVRSPGSSGIQSYAVTDNPVFKVKIRSLATDLEQGQGQGRKDSETDYTKKYKVGDIVRGTKSGSEKEYTGKIIKIVKNEEGEGSAFIVIDKKSKDEIKLDASTCSKNKDYQHSKKDAEEVNFFADAKILRYNEFTEKL